MAHFYIFLHITGMPIRQIEGISRRRRHTPPLHRLRLKNQPPSSNQIIFFVSFQGYFAKTGVKTLTFQDEIFEFASLPIHLIYSLLNVCKCRLMDI